MAITVSVKSYVSDMDTADATIATALNTGITYTSIYGVFMFPISNTKLRIFIVYA